MWPHSLALSLKDQGPVVVAVNPGSMLGSKMVKEDFGVAGKDIRIGAEILIRAELGMSSKTLPVNILITTQADLHHPIPMR